MDLILLSDGGVEEKHLHNDGGRSAAAGPLSDGRCVTFPRLLYSTYSYQSSGKPWDLVEIQEKPCCIGWERFGAADATLEDRFASSSLRA